MRRLIALFMLALITLGGLIGATPASAAQRTRCFAETNHCISGVILDYWERNGGLPTFGYPISDLQVETNDGWTGPTQWFERDRLEDHGSLGVLAGRLGAHLLEDQGRAWETFPRVSSAPPGCRYFPETGHSLCGLFLSYWERNGGLARFGFPVTEPFSEITGPDSQGPAHPLQVQYFERRRMEEHPENVGTPYEVLLGLLGRDISYPCREAQWPLAATVAAYWQSIISGCPIWSYPHPEGVRAVQLFERGSMVWVKGGPRGPDLIYVIFFFNQISGSLVWESYEDTWREGDPASGGKQPPPGLYEPIRGFGKLWRENEHVRNTVGWATAPESADNGVVQEFVGGTLMLYRSTSDRVFILRNHRWGDNRADDVPLIP